MPQHITVVEDEPDIAEVIRYALTHDGFEVEAHACGNAALEAIRLRPPDLVVLDLMLPGLDGLELMRIIKRDPAMAGVALVVLSARTEEMDRIVGLELGADDYLTKPFSPRELALRIRAVLRRGLSGAPEAAVVEVGTIRLDAGAHEASLAGAPLVLTATEFRLLLLLMERRDRVQTRAQLLSEVWEYAGDVDSRTVDTHVRRLRRKLASEGDRIETVIGIGYRLRS